MTRHVWGRTCDFDNRMLSIKLRWNADFLASVESFAQDLRARYPAPELERLETYYESLLSRRISPLDPRQKPSMGMFPGLRAQPWWEPHESAVTTEVAQILEGSYRDLQREIQSAVDTHAAAFSYYDGVADRYPGLQPGEWQALKIYERGQFTQASGALPRTVRVISGLLPWIIGEVTFLALRPGGKIPPHTDFTNAQLTCHLGLVVPENCWLEVAGEARTWQEGKTLFFDHSFPHTAWNAGGRTRIILLADVAHPDMTYIEREVMQAASARLPLT